MVHGHRNFCFFNMHKEIAFSFMATDCFTLLASVLLRSTDIDKETCQAPVHTKKFIKKVKKNSGKPV